MQSAAARSGPCCHGLPRLAQAECCCGRVAAMRLPRLQCAATHFRSGEAQQLYQMIAKALRSVIRRSVIC